MQSQLSLANDFKRVESVLDKIDWSFTSIRNYENHGISPFDCRKHHWYPATFIPAIPFTLVEILTHPKATVYDPFSGIGTTYFQALLLGRKPFATENCRIATEFTKSLFLLFNPDLLHSQMVDEICEEASKYNAQSKYFEEMQQTKDFQAIVNELSDWYAPGVFNQLSYLFLMENKCADTSKRAAMRIAISAILKATCGQTRGWGCIADNMKPDEKQKKKTSDIDAIRVFQNHIRRLLCDIGNHLKFISADYREIYNEASHKQTIFQADNRYFDGIGDSSIDLVVTSPTYPNMTDYVKSQRLSYYWLGLSVTKDNEDGVREIGARRKRGMKDSLSQYVSDMKKCNESLSKKIADGGYVCFVLPEFGNLNQNDSERKEVIQQVINDFSNHLLKEKEIERIVPAGRKSHNIKWATLEREKIYIFRKTKKA